MANTRYSFANEQFLSGQLNWLAQTFKVVLINTNLYIPLPAVHHTLADIPTNARIAISPALSGKTATLGVAKAGDLVIPTVNGPTIGAWIIFQDGGTDLSSTLIAYIDTAIGLPWNPQGLNVTIHWDTGPNGIFRL